jgi:Uma2 family endonuclease
MTTTTILDMPEVRERISRLTVEEYHRLDEYNERGRRTELIRGIVIEKMSKSPLHRIVISMLYDLIAATLPKGFALWMEQPLTLTDSEPEPDISITIGNRADYARHHPTTAELVIEVAVHSVPLDRALASVYAEAGVKEYWIVIAPERRVEVYHQPRNGKFHQTQAYGDTETIACSSVPGLTIRVSDFFEASE